MSTGSGDEATERAASAARRAHEVKERLVALRAGNPSTADDVRRAERAVEVEQEQSLGAHRRAARAHLQSATSHRRASEVLEAAGHPVEAAEHRRRAVLDEEAARADEEAGQLGLPS